MRLASPPRRKALGQHHLVSGRFCRSLLRFLDPGGCEVVEIGAGGGVLTMELLRAGASRVLALELDPLWALEMKRRLEDRRLQIAVGDALELGWERLPPGVLITGNLPYAIGTALLLRLLERVDGVPRAAFLLQREVVERIVARRGTRPYGALAVLVGARAEARQLETLGPEAFRPRPRVESAFVGLRFHSARWPPREWVGFVRTVRAAFGQPRKTLANSLAGAWGRERALELCAALGLPRNLRAADLGLEEFRFLAARAFPAGGPALEEPPIAGSPLARL